MTPPAWTVLTVGDGTCHVILPFDQAIIVDGGRAGPIGPIPVNALRGSSSGRSR